MITNSQSGTNVHEIADGQLEPTTLACMHGSAWRADGAALIRALATTLA